MRKEFKMLILEISLVIVIILLFVGMFNFDKDFKFIRFVSVGNLLEEHEKVSSAANKYNKSSKEYDTSMKTLESEKSMYEFEKNKYLSITNENLWLIKEATADEKFDIEYMWITLGNYAKRNNLDIYLLEPGASVQVQNQAQNKPHLNQIMDEKDITNNQISGNINDKVENKKPENNTEIKDVIFTDNNEFQIQVRGSYINLAEFVFNIENDKSLRFKLDKINMKLVSGTKVEATFVVKNLKFVK